MIWWDWEVILLLFEWEGGGRKGCLEKRVGTSMGSGKEERMMI